MSAAELLTRGRVVAERLMVDACDITRGSGEPVVDDNTGELTYTQSDVYAGKCKLQQRTASAQSQQPGEDYQLLLQMELHLPISAPALEVGDVVTMTAAVHDPELVGQVFVVRDLFAKTFATARRVGVTRRTS